MDNSKYDGAVLIKYINSPDQLQNDYQDHYEDAAFPMEVTEEYIVGEEDYDYQDDNDDNTENSVFSIDLSEIRSEKNQKAFVESSVSNSNKKAIWNKSDTELMIGIFKEMKPLLGQTVKTKTKKQVFELVAKKMEEKGAIYTSVQVESKLKTLRKKHQRTKGKNPYSFEKDPASETLTNNKFHNGLVNSDFPTSDDAFLMDLGEEDAVRKEFDTDFISGDENDDCNQKTISFLAEIRSEENRNEPNTSSHGKALWTVPDTKLMISIFNKYKLLLGQTAKTKTKKQIWELVSKKMEEKGVFYTPGQVESKLKGIRRRRHRRSKQEAYYMRNESPGMGKNSCFEDDLTGYDDRIKKGGVNPKEKAVWCEADTNLLIALYNELQPQLKPKTSFSTTSDLYDLISKRMAEQNVFFNAVQVEDKCKKMRLKNMGKILANQIEMEALNSNENTNELSDENYDSSKSQNDDHTINEDVDPEFYKEHIEKLETLDPNEIISEHVSEYEPSIDEYLIENEEYIEDTETEISEAQTGNEKKTWRSSDIQLMLSIYKKLRPNLGKIPEARTKKKIWDQVSAKMAEEGVYFSSEQINRKWRRLQEKYKLKLRNGDFNIKHEDDTNQSNDEIDDYLENDELLDDYLSSSDDVDFNLDNDFLDPVSSQNDSMLSIESRLFVLTKEVSDIKKIIEKHEIQDCEREKQKIEILNTLVSEVKRSNQLTEMLLNYIDKNS